MNYINRKNFMYGSADDYGYGVDAGIGSNISSGPGGGDPNPGGGGVSPGSDNFPTYQPPEKKGITNLLGNIGNYYQNNSKGILGSLIGSALFGPLGLVLGGYAGRNFDNIRNRFAPGVDIRDEGEITADRFPTYNFQTPFSTFPNPEAPYPDISNQMAKLNRSEKTELGALKTQKENSDFLGPLTPEQEQRMQDLENKEKESNLGLGTFIV
jgi:hypothetical protein|tara:strand:- start:64 stop:696 length:633 start_codon:yes stop_codon:yes gene_type:complete